MSLKILRKGLLLNLHLYLFYQQHLNLYMSLFFAGGILLTVVDKIKAVYDISLPVFIYKRTDLNI